MTSYSEALTPACVTVPGDRNWRVRIFAVTWLAYAGFYLCRKNLSAAASAAETSIFKGLSQYDYGELTVHRTLNCETL